MDHQEKLKQKPIKEMNHEAEPTSERPDSSKARRKSPYLTTAAMIKFASLPKKKKFEASESKKSKDGVNFEGPFGFGCVVIPALQRFNNIRFFLLVYCLLIFSQGTVFGLVDLSTTSFVKDYYLGKSSKLALMFSYDVSSLLVALFIAYFGARGSRPKWIAMSSLLIGFGSLLFAVPYVNIKKVRQTEDIKEMCQETKNEGCPKNKQLFASKFIHYFILGQVLQGIAGMPNYVLGMSFMYDSVHIHSSGIYLGLREATQLFGYGFGYIIGAPQMKSQKSHDGMEIASEHNANRKRSDDDESLWHLSWTSGFFSASIVAWCTFLPLLCFPKILPGTGKIRALKEKHPCLFDIKLKDKEFGPNLKDLLTALWFLMKNPLFISQAFCKTTESLVFIGASEFLPIYMESQFLLSPSTATMITGLLLIPAGGIGTFLGGVIVGKLEMSFQALMRFTIVTSAVSAIFLSLVFFVHCETVAFAGINENYDGTGKVGNLTAPCNAHCGCSKSTYSSVCGRDEVEYFSPCFAGCTVIRHLQERTVFYNCTCIKQGLATSEEEADFVDAVSGKCNKKCYKLPLFIAFVLCAIIYSSVSAMPIILTILQSVPESLNSLAIGLSYVFLRVFGTIPGPLVFKAMAETSCSFWDSNKCGYKAHCWIYNKSKIVYMFVGICFLCKICTVFFTGLGYYATTPYINDQTDNMPVMVQKSHAKPKGKG